MTDSQVECQLPHLSNREGTALSEGDFSAPQKEASIQEEESHVAPATPIEGRPPTNTAPFEEKKSSLDGDAPAIEELAEARLERLGRQRPEVFGSLWAEIGFVFSISMSQVLTV